MFHSNQFNQNDKWSCPLSLKRESDFHTEGYFIKYYAQSTEENIMDNTYRELSFDFSSALAIATQNAHSTVGVWGLCLHRKDGCFINSFSSLSVGRPMWANFIMKIWSGIADKLDYTFFSENLFFFKDLFIYIWNLVKSICKVALHVLESGALLSEYLLWTISSLVYDWGKVWSIQMLSRSDLELVSCWCWNSHSFVH